MEFYGTAFAICRVIGDLWGIEMGIAPNPQLLSISTFYRRAGKVATR
jgi:hypothetical protein